MDTMVNLLQITKFKIIWANRLSFIGKEQDKESSLHVLGMQKYDNGSGRFLSSIIIFEQ